MFGNRERVINLYAEIADRAFDLDVAEQELHGSALPWSGAVSGCQIHSGQVRCSPPNRLKGEHIGGLSSLDRAHGGAQ
jgi:hypothetical protein